VARPELAGVRDAVNADANASSRFDMSELVRVWISWAYERNQFFDFDTARIARLRAIHCEFIDAIVDAARSSPTFGNFTEQALRCLARYASSLEEFFRPLVSAEGFGGRGAEYSAELQLGILDLRLDRLREPIVDLGCGVDAKLVKHLRAANLAATGVERRSAAPNVILADWFDVRFESESIGTIISHLAFSLHFLHQHWQGGDRAYHYASKYMELLRSLVRGGCFCYAPGLPFIEALLPTDEYVVTKSTLPEPLASAMASLRDIGTGESVAYACQVRRQT
jgi:hypothetical protein